MEIFCIYAFLLRRHQWELGHTQCLLNPGRFSQSRFVPLFQIWPSFGIWQIDMFSVDKALSNTSFNLISNIAIAFLITITLNPVDITACQCLSVPWELLGFPGIQLLQFSLTTGFWLFVCLFVCLCVCLFVCLFVWEDWEWAPWIAGIWLLQLVLDPGAIFWDPPQSQRYNNLAQFGDTSELLGIGTITIANMGEFAEK